MFFNVEKNFFINMSLAVIGFVCVVTGIVLKFRLLGGNSFAQLHEWTGYLAAAIVIVHLLMHNKWIISVTKKLFASKKKVALLLLSVLIPIGVVPPC